MVQQVEQPFMYSVSGGYPYASLAYYTTPAIMLPQAFHIMIQVPPWNMDTRASSHLTDNTDNTCILSSFSNSSIYPSVFVGNGQSISVTHIGHSFLHTSDKPLQLNHILVTPHIIRNLISVRKFTRDNDVSVEFDAHSFSVKDYQTGRLLLRCDSTGDLYPDPVITESKLGSDGDSVKDPTLYCNLAGALQYLTFSRPNLSYVVQHVCFYMHDPREPHFTALKRILRYVRGTLDYGLQIHVSSTAQLTAYTDADWSGCPVTRRSASGYCVILGDNLLSWSAKCQVTLSRSRLHTPLFTTTLVYCDNVSVVYMSANPVQHQRTKHIEIYIHFVRDYVAFGQVRVLHVPSRFQYADIFTNGLPSALFLEFRSTQDTITVNQAIRDGDTLVSADEMFELGFFSPGSSKNRYLGIWYKNISPQTVVWVANRETPITDSSGVFRVHTNRSLLVIAGSNNTVVWSSNTNIVSPTSINPVAQILNTGNLVVRGNNEESFVWQSFDYPGDTYLAGMKFGKDLVSGIDRRWTPWKSIDDPSPGEYVAFMDTNGFPQLREENGSVPIMRLGPWNGITFNSLPNHGRNSILTHEFVFNDKEVFYRYALINSSAVVSRVFVSPEGDFSRMNWINRTQQCCMEGFVPRNPEEWSASEWSSGCRRKTPLNCPNGDGFRVFKNVKLPDTRRSWYNRNMTLAECGAACELNCSCIAYSTIDITKGNGCLMWFDELMDIRTVDDSQDLYVRMAISDLTITSEPGSTSKPSSNKKRSTMVVAVSLSSTLVMVILIFGILYAWSKKKRPLVKTPEEPVQTIDEEYSMEDQEDDTELTSFSLSTIRKYTNDFANDNKLGEGGFGPVYKGILNDGREIAVKRMSETSRQGILEFKNELKFIAKLQHRNLVKLLGYCVQGDESMLIYEYMPNKSLDLFIFDKIKSLKLDWSTRFDIIHGIARGLLYLHHDSRFKIVHRDLKASNVLLDDEMNPKISDFGLARMFREHENEANTNNVVGTLGYISPEYAVDGTYSEKSDVFSFGVLVLEIVSGKKNRGFSHEKDSDNLLAHAWRLYEEGMTLELLSAHMRDSCVDSEVLRAIHIGLLCVQHYAKDRPTMSSVVSMFDQDGELPRPKHPAFFAEGQLRSDAAARVLTSSLANPDGVTRNPDAVSTVCKHFFKPSFV
nr:G-type lectin S-receptor-like serine/threonine-protein kinase At4g27290 [Tanacetum cinerariifolium]